jgi:hypothetical protein
MSNPLILIYNITHNTFVNLPIFDYTNLSVIWDSEGGNNNTKTHMFTSPGIKTIRIYGNVKTLMCGDLLSSDKYIIQCPDFGDVGLTKISFKHAEQLQKLPPTLPHTVINLSELCANTNFNDNISGWDTSRVINFNYCFKNNPTYNQPVWTSVPINTCTRLGMYENASKFNQDISELSVSNTTNLDSAFKNTAISVEHFTKAYIAWATQPNLVSCVFKNNTLVYSSDAEEARETLQQHGWEIEDDLIWLNPPLYTNKQLTLKYNHKPWAEEYIQTVIKIQNSSHVITQGTEHLFFNLIFPTPGNFKIPIQLNNVSINTVNIEIIPDIKSSTREVDVITHSTPTTRDVIARTTFNRINMGSLFTNNAQVYYKSHSLTPGGIGGVRNYRVKSNKT